MEPEAPQVCALKGTLKAVSYRGPIERLADRGREYVPGLLPTFAGELPLLFLPLLMAHEGIHGDLGQADGLPDPSHRRSCCVLRASRHDPNFPMELFQLGWTGIHCRELLSGQNASCTDC